MIHNIKNKLTIGILVLIMFLGFNACKKDGNPNNLPSVNPGDYDGKIDGFSSSDEIFPDRLIAYWSFDDTKNELKSATAPTASVNNTFITGGVRGKALSLNAGYLYYATQFQKFKTDSLKSFTISQWVQILNNGSKKTMIFQLARPTIFNGNINFVLETNLFPASNIDNLKIHPTFTTVGGGTQDNINTLRDSPGMPNYIPYITPTIGANTWVHLLLTYNGNTGFFHIWSNGIRAGAFPSRGTGNSLFKSWEPNQVLIGANYNAAGMPVNADVTFAPMTGSVDEIRMYDFPLPDAFIKALYNLGRAGK
ncbi:MAG: LamG domain-containing protein [Chitinophagaceae bacterium]|nr:LamG domain-containing protein [Chitinophagaceae bacterium]MBK8311897.1 LamG domain-containing protein [Chitinophagaceae bacterium]MBK8608076.1 LamG domain-containing protein [Chitinophagaceae bacterium]MBP6477685.1 LamG domain-containing protein [Chitinophagaceae bacterium]MBP7107387.1 LamG domain-containing protein [Chitinophagaceae bacterium]